MNNSDRKFESYFVPPAIAEQRLRSNFGTHQIGYVALNAWTRLIMDIGTRMGLQLSPQDVQAALLGFAYNASDTDNSNPSASLNAMLLPLLNVTEAARYVLKLPQ